VPISAIARFLLHYAWDHGLSEPALAPANGQKIAVLGSGIGGLVGADALSRLGYAITVMDSRPKPGGRMVNGLPGFRVNTSLIERRIELLKKRGVQFRMGLAYGKDVKLSELRREFDAVFLALARVEPVPLQIPGAQLADVELASMFLAQATGRNGANKKPVEIHGRRVAVLGGGDTAMNALRTAIRLGAAQAVCIYRRDEANMPATLDQFQNAIEEGAQFEFLAQPVSVIDNSAGKVAGVRCVRMQLKKNGAPGRPEVQSVINSEFEVPTDVVLVAYGYKPARLPQMEAFAELGMDELGCIPVDGTHMTNLEGVFAGGSIVRGPVPISEVVRDARAAVAAIDHYLLAKREQRADKVCAKRAAPCRQ
jgi:glutamate synthase (NADPH/NADH) small chain